MTNDIHFVLQKRHNREQEISYFFSLQAGKKDTAELLLLVTQICFPFKYVLECEGISKQVYIILPDSTEEVAEGIYQQPR